MTCPRGRCMYTGQYRIYALRPGCRYGRGGGHSRASIFGWLIAILRIFLVITKDENNGGEYNEKVKNKKKKTKNRGKKHTRIMYNAGTMYTRALRRIPENLPNGARFALHVRHASLRSRSRCLVALVPPLCFQPRSHPRLLQTALKTNLPLRCIVAIVLYRCCDACSTNFPHNGLATFDTFDAENTRILSNENEINKWK